MLPDTAKSAPLWAAALAALAGFLAIYVTLGLPDNAVSPSSPPEARKQSPGVLAPVPRKGWGQGQMAAFVLHSEPRPLPEVKFQDGAGRERTLADWHGKVVLLNLWATWCLPCRKEMPALDRLQQELASEAFQVVAVSVDRSGIAGARKFLAEAKVERLSLYADQSARMASTLNAAGLPATLLIDREGREIGRLLGPAEWDGEDAKRLIKSALN